MFRRLAVASAVAVFTLSPLPALAGDKEVYQKITPGVALVLTETQDKEGRPTGSAGTAWVADRKNRLLVTNYHVVEAARSVRVYFQECENGKLMTSLGWYRSLGEG